MMAARFTLQDIAGSAQAINKRRGKTPRTRAARLQAAPGQPVAIQTRYTSALFKIIDGLRLISLDALKPLLREDKLTLNHEGMNNAKLDADDIGAIFRALRLRMGEALSLPQLRRIIEGVAEDIDIKNASDVGRLLGIDLGSDVTLSNYLGDFIRENVRLVESVTFEQLDRMEEIVRESLVNGTPVARLRDALVESFDLPKNRAALIARDQTLKANAELTQLRQQRAGVTEYIWTSSRDERVRGKPGGKWSNSESDHWSLDGQRCSWLNPPVTNDATGERNHPGQDYQCRCIAIPVTDALLGIDPEED